MSTTIDTARKLYAFFDEASGEREIHRTAIACAAWMKHLIEHATQDRADLTSAEAREDRARAELDELKKLHAMHSKMWVADMALLNKTLERAEKAEREVEGLRGDVRQAERAYEECRRCSGSGRSE